MATGEDSIRLLVIKSDLLFTQKKYELEVKARNEPAQSEMQKRNFMIGMLIACLIAIGLQIKDLKIFMERKGIYNITNRIRTKLNLNNPQTDLYGFITMLLDKEAKKHFEQ
ncbi:MAG: hypothetical protein K2J15_04565 [Muribaculaceae bacterium]|nr:hypothetical protein [Muribaculaceae bacterium]